MHNDTNYEWLASDAAIQIWKEMHAHGASSLRSSKTLADVPNRKQIVVMLEEQWNLAHLSRTKFPHPEDWFWTRRLLEQSSDGWCAEETAKDFPADAKIVDVCCGAGADALALASRCQSVRCVDLSPTSVSLVRANSKLQNKNIEIICGPAEGAEIRPGELLHIDPDRRLSGKRVTAIEGFEPKWSVVRRLIEMAQGASLKVAPATDWTELDSTPDTIRFLSRERSVRQQRWLWKLQRWPAGSIVLSVLARSGWVHEIFDQRNDHDRTNDPEEAGFPDAYVADYDPVVRAAKVSARFAERIGCQMLDRAGGYLTAKQCLPHEMVRWFRVLDVLPMDAKKWRAYARTADVGTWELKSRGVTIDLDKSRRELPVNTKSNKFQSLLFSRISGRPRVIAAEPLGGWGIPLSN